jgi:hypothetical protein
MIEVHLYGKLRRFSDSPDTSGDSIVRVPVQKGDTIADIARHCRIPLEEIGPNIFLNGQYSALERKVADGDRLGLFPDNMALLYKWYFTRVT